MTPLKLQGRRAGTQTRGQRPQDVAVRIEAPFPRLRATPRRDETIEGHDRRIAGASLSRPMILRETG